MLLWNSRTKETACLIRFFQFTQKPCESLIPCPNNVFNIFPFIFKDVLDGNVLISVLFWSRAEATIVELVEAGNVEGYISQDIMDELNRVLKYPRFGLTNVEAEDTGNYYITVLAMVTPKVRGDFAEEDPEDD